MEAYEQTDAGKSVLSKCRIKVISIPSSEDGQKPGEFDSAYAEQLQKQYDDIKDTYVRQIEKLKILQNNDYIVSIIDYFVQRAKPVGWTISVCMEDLSQLDWDTLSQSGRNYSTQYEKRGLEDRACSFGLVVSEALLYCENLGFRLSEIRPEYIYCLYSGNYKIDLLSATELKPQQYYSVPEKYHSWYTAPEIYAENGTCAERGNATVYSLGILLYCMMNNGCFPLEPQDCNGIRESERRDSFLRRMRGEDFDKPVDGSKAFTEIIMKACAANPQDRYANIYEMRRALLKLSEMSYEERMNPKEEDMRAIAPKRKSGWQTAGKETGDQYERKKTKESREGLFTLACMAIFAGLLLFACEWLIITFRYSRQEENINVTTETASAYPDTENYLNDDAAEAEGISEVTDTAAVDNLVETSESPEQMETYITDQNSEQGETSELITAAAVEETEPESSADESESEIVVILGGEDDEETESKTEGSNQRSGSLAANEVFFDVLNIMFKVTTDFSEWELYSENMMLVTPDSCINDFNLDTVQDGTYYYTTDNYLPDEDFSFLCASYLVLLNETDSFSVEQTQETEYQVYYGDKLMGNCKFETDSSQCKNYFLFTPVSMDTSEMEFTNAFITAKVRFLEIYNDKVKNRKGWDYFDNSRLVPTPDSCIEGFNCSLSGNGKYYYAAETNSILAYEILLVKECGFVPEMIDVESYEAFKVAYNTNDFVYFGFNQEETFLVVYSDLD
ncbi:MAG: hypothetical protein LUI87_06695 [Lachnospiraceae bacterium]|nr:hypothetical protein [Lachnospiraceae bacterium]